MCWKTNLCDFFYIYISFLQLLVLKNQQSFWKLDCFNLSHNLKNNAHDVRQWDVLQTMIKYISLACVYIEKWMQK